MRFFIFLEEKNGQKFNGKGEGVLSETSFKFNIYDNFFDRLLATVLVTTDEGISVYVYNERTGYFIKNNELGTIFTRNFYQLFKKERGEGLSIEKAFKDNEKDFNVKCKVLKVKNSLPQRVLFEINSFDNEGGHIVFDILEAGDIPVNVPDSFNFSDYYDTSNLFEFLRSLQ
ncbi:MAG: hypothetical protein ACP5QT_01775 [Brevinematia bacterium]